MKKSLLASAALMAAMTISGTALAEGNYGSLNLGLSSIDGFSDNSTLDTVVGGIPLESAFDFSSSKSISGALGRRMSPNLRMEIELNYRNADMSSKLTSLSFGGSPAVEAVAPVAEGDILVPFSPATAYVPPVEAEFYTQAEIDGLRSGASLKEDGTAYTAEEITALIADTSVRITGVTGVTAAYYTQPEIDALVADTDLKEDGSVYTADEIAALVSAKAEIPGSVRVIGVTGVTEEFYTALEITKLTSGVGGDIDPQTGIEYVDDTTIAGLIPGESVKVIGVEEVTEEFYTADEITKLTSGVGGDIDPQTGIEYVDDTTIAGLTAHEDVVIGSARITGVEEVIEVLYTQDEINLLQVGASLKEDGTAYAQAEIDALEAGTSVKITGQAEIPAQDDAIEEVVAGPDDVVAEIVGVEADEPIILTASERGIGDIESTTALVNVYYDFTSESKFTPYLSLGAGMGWHTAAISDYTITMSKGDEVLAVEHVAGTSAKDHAFAYQLGFGGSYEVAKSTYLTAGYRHIGSAALNFDGIDADIGVHEINAGIRMEF